MPQPASALASASVRRSLYVVLILALLVRVGLVWATTETGTQIVDEQHYTALARSVAAGTGFAWEDGSPTSIRPPLYPAFVAAIWTLTGSNSLTAVRIAQIGVSLLLVVVTFQLATRVFAPRVALIAAAGVAFYPSLLFSGVLLLSETLFTLLLVTTLLGCVALFERPRLLVALGTGAALGAGALTRSVLWPFVPVLTLALCVMVPGSARRRVAVAACVALGALLVIAPWAVRNTRLQNTLTVVDTMGGLNLLMGNYEYTPEHRMWDAISLTGDQAWYRNLPPRAPDGSKWTEGGKEAWAKQQAAAYMTSHPGTTIRRSLLKFADFWGIERDFIAGVSQGLYSPPKVPAIAAAVLMAAAYCATMLLATLGIVTVMPNWRAHALFLLVVVFVCAVHSVVFGHPRYHLPLIPILLMYAAAAIDAQAWRRLRSSVPALAAASVGIVMFSGIWTHELFWRDADKIQQVTQLIGGWW